MISNKVRFQQKGSLELYMTLPILICFLWGSSLLAILIKKKSIVSRHAWNYGISSWNQHSQESYDSEVKKIDSHITIDKNKPFKPTTSLIKKIPLPFKLFQSHQQQEKVNAEYAYNINLKSYTLNKYLKQMNVNNIKTSSTVWIPNSGRKKDFHKKTLKHLLWLQGMCYAGFNELFLPILGTEILLEVAAGVKLPFKIDKTNKIKKQRCDI